MDMGGRNLHTFDQDRHFKIASVSQYTMDIVTNRGKHYFITHKEIENAWDHVIREGSISLLEIQEKYSKLHPEYVEAILKAIHGKKQEPSVT